MLSIQPVQKQGGEPKLSVVRAVGIPCVCACVWCDSEGEGVSLMPDGDFPQDTPLLCP